MNHSLRQCQCRLASMNMTTFLCLENSGTCFSIQIITFSTIPSYILLRQILLEIVP